MIDKKKVISLIIAGASALLIMFAFKFATFAVAPKKNPLPSDYNTGISWEEAEKINKPIAVLFYVDWCNYCRKFAPVFDDYRKKYSSEYNFVIVKSDAPENEKIVKQYYIPGYPTVYLVEKKKNRKNIIDPQKYFNNEEFTQELKDFLK